MKTKLQLCLASIAIIMLICACDAKVKNGFVKENDGWTYYYVNDEKQIGWQKINGDWYYFYETEFVDGERKGLGSMKQNTYLKQGNDWYFFKGDGKMLNNSWLNDYETGYSYFMQQDGKMAINTQLEIDGKLYKFDSQGIGKEKPAYNIVFNCTFPKSFESYYGTVIIENIGVDWNSNNDGFVTKWTGTCGYPARYYSNTSCSRSVGWKLYDPDGYVIDTGTFYTDAMVYGDKFRDKKEIMGYNKCKMKGDYRLELMNSR